MVPFMIVSGVAKEMLTPGDEPPWMQGWLDGYLSYGWDRAGLLGVPQMYGNWLFRENRGFFPQGGGVFAGPMADQMEALFIGVPFGDRTLGTELLSGLPGGNLTKRLAA